ncbi:ABC-type Fe3+-hydroxamate transport system, periplasmic component [Pseudonocardia sp. Ae168_Ps1]|uniref:iron-siderophore ABC transporter substrate-binding protein n=1 Tax=unclassified Pseudonocardia TaxID=2619320 RepID=UPI00094B0043|nr:MULTISPECIES: iron-siderophore ABC transporter substrate-binding protein [unclassified Pseudonocardia]OLL76211.1 ABC-type Fe3+-hydroxamate transport system, periplasmic component [Pseudonocardia sp. Ae150A_Ps1]OLL82211.1 ABC-type Fe3+-hydroxamate transport system, periplasmic component [Pseudonocardia sp. Ae168_Ps1]OLL83674.1 ABC-type Fe3+-hydroxamate transport system, periplasmic component [Pseudonocardia sp. Ae263_Ps1]OLL90285.1 ABC-type Fe3+-hydroxamate transport system, periplasmic compo
MLRRTPSVLAALLAALALLAGCGSGSDSAPGGEGATAPAADGAFPVTIPTAFGEVTVSEQPQRVVALGWSDAETALALGVEPVGAADWLAVGDDGLGPWVPQDYTTPPTVLGTLEVDLEAVAALDPDLILDTRAAGTRDRYDRLTQLGVPVVSIPAGGENYLTNWRDQLRMVGAAVGRPGEAAQLQSGLEQRFADARAQHPQLAGATVVSGARNTLGEYAAYTAGSGRMEFLEELGMTLAPQIAALPTEGFSTPISRERMNLLDADVTVMQPIGKDATEIENDPLWQAVPSVAAGRGVLLSDRDVSQAFSAASVQGWTFALDRTVPRLADAAAAAP